MAATPSTMLALGTSLPAFDLPDTDGNIVRSDSFKNKNGLLVVFMCNHCPFVKHVHEELSFLGKDCEENGIGIVGINSNDVVTHPTDAPSYMKETKKTWNFTFPYLFDETQSVAKAFKAACTPDFYLFDKEMRLVYRGQFDDSRPNNGKPVTGKDVRDAIEALVNGQQIEQTQYPSIGCNIKWSAGNEPEYFHRYVIASPQE